MTLNQSPGLIAATAALVCLSGIIETAFAADEELTGPHQEDPVAQNSPPAHFDADIVRKAKRDLATRLGLSCNEIEVVEFREVTWRNGSVGCPRPGMAYKQVLVNGSLILLRAGGTDYEYHAGGGRDPFYCAEPEAPLPAGAEGFGDI